MAWLLIDNSNSRTKLRLADSNGLLEWRATVPTSGLSPETLGETLAGVDFSGVVLASVVPEKAEMISRYFDGVREFHALSHRSPLDYEFDLDHPEQIGNDRLSNVLALKSIHGAPGIAIDFGTAVTFSVLSAEGNFAGGVIAPGMAAMTQYLATRTAQLPEISPEEPANAIGKTTVEAMRAGAVIGQRGMVREILRELVRETGGSPRIVATGGGAEFAAKGLPEIDVLHPDLTLEGLRLLAARVFQ